MRLQTDVKFPPIQFLFGLCLLASLTSCATLLNGSYDRVNVVTDIPSRLTVNDDTLDFFSTHKTVYVQRSAEPLVVTATSTGDTAKTMVSPKNSAAFWLNIYFNYGLGMLVDKDSPRRYDYPHVVYLAFSDSSAKPGLHSLRRLMRAPRTPIFTYGQVNDSMNSIVKITPLKVLGWINPAVELSYERWTGKRLSTELTASLMLPRPIMDTDGTKYDTRGFYVALEQRWYYRNSAPVGPYVALELNHLHSRYRSGWIFGEPDPFAYPEEQIRRSYFDDFGIRKRTTSLNFKWGLQYVIGRMAFDLYFGLGLKYRDVRHFDRFNPQDPMRWTRHPNIHYISNRENANWSVSVPLNFKLGWVF